MNMPIKEPMTGMQDSQMLGKQEQRDMRVLYGTYADVLFVLLPFVVIALFRVWTSDLRSVLLSHDISVAAAVLAGLAVVRFITGMMSDQRMLKHRERIVFLVAGTVFLVLVPALLFSVLIMMTDPVPNMVMFLQPLLIVLGIMAYSGAVASTNILRDRQDAAEEQSAL